MKQPPEPVTTPDGRYIVVRGRLWRAADPLLEPGVRRKLVDELMDARRAVRAALRTSNVDDLSSARARVQASKEALGERGAVWWSDGAPDFNRHLVQNTPYAEWWRANSPP